MNKYLFRLYTDSLDAKTVFEDGLAAVNRVIYQTGCTQNIGQLVIAGVCQH